MKKETKFRNDFHKLSVNIMQAHSWLTARHAEIYKKYNLTAPQYNVLRILRDTHPDPVMVNLLKERMMDKMSDASRLVERLRVKGFLDRQVSRKDRRKADVIITQKGLDLLTEMEDSESEFDKVLGNLTKDEVKKMNGFIEKMIGPDAE